MLSLFLGFGAAKAQQSVFPADADTLVATDTIHYYFNKHYFKAGPSSFEQFPYYKSSASTTTRVTHVGSKFLNNEPIDIYGLEAFMNRHQSSTFPVVKVRLYLCTLQNNLPVLPALDSVEVDVTGDTFYVAPRGGKFKNDKVYTLNQDFAVLMRNASIHSGDTVRLMRTWGKPHSNINVPWSEKYSDGFGYVRYGGQFHSTTDFTTAPGFGKGTDYEFCVAPMVQYTLTSSHDPYGLATDMVNGICAFEPMNYKSLSSKRFLHRQYNMVAFHSYWKYFSDFAPGTTQGVFPNDSAIVWFFQPADRFGYEPRRFLRYDTQTNDITMQVDSVYFKPDGSDSIHCFDANFYRTRFKSMRIYGKGWYELYQDSFLICTKACGRVHPGIEEQGYLTEVSMYPNPTTGDVYLKGLNPGATISVYNIQGQLVFKDEARPGLTKIDLTRKSPGVYLIQMSDGVHSRTLRFLKE